MLLLAWVAGVAYAQDAAEDPAPEDFTVVEDNGAQDKSETFSLDNNESFWGKKVKSIQYDVPPWIDKKELRRVVKIKTGKELLKWRVRKTIQRIYLLGYIDNVIIKSEARGADQVDVIIKVIPKYVLRDIRILDNTAYSDDEIMSDILGISEGDDFYEGLIDGWKQKLEKALGDVGYLNAKARFSFQKTKMKVDNKVDLTINVDENSQFKIGRISLDGDIKPFSRHEILSILKLRTGETYETEKVTKGLKRLRKTLKKKQYLESRIPEWDMTDPDNLKIDKKTNKVDVILPINVGALVLIRFGECFTCAQKKWKLPQEINLENQRRFNKWIVKDFETKIADYYRARGYFNATITGTYEETTIDGHPTKIIQLERELGEKLPVREIDFKNNPSFKDKELRALLTSSDYFLESNIDKDLQNVINFYNRSGFLRAKIMEKRLRVVEDDGLYIQVILDEGPRTILTEIKTQGFEVFKGKQREEILAQVHKLLKEDEPLNPFVITDAKAQFIAAYLRKGYIRARVKDELKISKDGKTATVTFTVDEGRKYFFGNVYVRGNKLTKKYVILRELFIIEGEPFSWEDVFSSEQALVQLGFFQSVQITPVDKDLTEENVDLLVDLKERNSGYIEYGLGYNTYFGYSASFEVGHKNLAGHGRRISYHVDGSMQDVHFRLDNRHMAVNFVWPWVARIPMDGKITIFDNQQQEIGYNLRQFGVTVGVSTYVPKLLNYMKSTRQNKDLRKLFNFYTLGTDYEYARDFIYELQPGVEQDPGLLQITVLQPSIMRDERDNPFNPTRGVKAQVGSVNKIYLRYSSPALMSQVHYLQAIAESSWYYGFVKLSDWGKLVFAQNFKVGHGQSLRDTDTIPISRRFYLGGSTSIRGFKPNSISPTAVDDTSLPIGGNFLVQSNTEFRVPLPKNLGILLFFDAGDVTATTNDFYIDLMRSSAGLGFRYITPIGPISADYGFKLDRRTDESIGEFAITIGNAF